MNKLGVITTAAALLLLAGCSSTPAPAAETIATTPDAVATTTPEPSAEPLAASTPTAEASSDDAQYLSEVRLRLKNLPDATDEQLLEAATTACANYASGQAKEDQRLIEGEQPDPALAVYWDSSVIATWAAKIYCTEYSS